MLVAKYWAKWMRHKLIWLVKSSGFVPTKARTNIKWVIKSRKSKNSQYNGKWRTNNFLQNTTLKTKNSLKIPKGYSEAANRRTDNAIAKKKKVKKTNNSLHNTTQKTTDCGTRTPLTMLGTQEQRMSCHRTNSFSRRRMLNR
jgi:hypothetical protein